MRLRWHLLGLTVAAVVPALLFSAAMIYKVTDQQRATLKSEIEDVTDILAREVDSQLLQTIAALEVLAASNALTEDDLKAFHVLAQRVLEAHAGWANIVLTGPEAEHLVNLRLPFGAPLPELINPAVYLETARSRQPRVSDVLVSESVVKRALTIVAVPVVQDGRAKYVLGAALEAGNWESFLRAHLPQDIMQATLVDRSRTIIARTVDNERAPGKKPVRHFLDAMDARPEGGLLRGLTLEGPNGFGAYRRMTFSGWTVSAFMPEEAIEGPVRASLAQLALGFVVLLALTLAFAWVLGKRIARSIGQLADSVGSVGQGGSPLPVDDRIAEVREAKQALEKAAALLADRLARELTARAVLEAADKAKDEYLTILAHELRNPLAPVSASLFLLENEPASEPGRRALAVIGRQVGHLSRLLDDLLDVTRLATGKVQLQSETVDLNEVLRRAADDYREIARKGNVELALELPARAVRAEGDPMRLGQTVGNLLQNSLRFTPAGGRIVLSLARAGASIEIRVRDTGAGIEPELLHKLFEPFSRGAQDSVRTRAGLGLGLAVVKELAELHGGSVQAMSAGPGMGAEFVVTLPALDAA